MGDDCAGSRQRYEGKSAKDQALGHIIIQGLNRGGRSEKETEKEWLKEGRIAGDFGG